MRKTQTAHVEALAHPSYPYSHSLDFTHSAPTPVAEAHPPTERHGWRVYPALCGQETAHNDLWILFGNGGLGSATDPL